MQYEELCRTIIDLLEAKGIFVPMEADGYTDFWSFPIGARIQGWVSIVNDDPPSFQASAVFGQIAGADGMENTLRLISTAFPLPFPLAFFSCGGRLMALGFTGTPIGFNEVRATVALEQLFDMSIKFANTPLIGVERLPDCWFNQS